jgi:pimeloyl-ACP methyl ester carboxylesterase
MRDPEDLMAAGSNPIPEGRYVTTDGGLSIHYHEAGSGEPIVFLHGSGPGASGYSNFKGNYSVFAANGYRAIVPDLPGFGLSSKPDTNYVLGTFANRPTKPVLNPKNGSRCVKVRKPATARPARMPARTPFDVTLFEQSPSTIPGTNWAMPE